MDRRTFLTASTALTLGWAVAAPRASADDSVSRFLLSEVGCGRATGYAEANKIVTWRGTTHAAYLDSPPEGFRVRIRTLDHATGQWSEAHTVDEAHDNHGGPALAVDSQGYLHVAYFPHHHPMRVKKSLQPNDASAWGAAEEVGERLTYPTLVIDDEDTLFLTCRQRDNQAPWVANFYTKKVGGAWGGPRALLQAEHMGYAHFMEALAWSPDGKILHLATRLHDNDPPRGHTVGYMKSADKGATWTRHDGTPITLPATAATIDIIRQERAGLGSGFRAAGLAVAPDGRPHVLYSDQDVQPNETWIATPGENGWESRSLRDALPPELAGWDMFVPGGISFNESGRLFAVLTVTPPGRAPGESGWGHPHCEVLALASDDLGKTFAAKLISKMDSQSPNWLANMERPTGHNIISGSPGIVYTEGGRGSTNTDILANRVHWVRW